MGHLAFPEVFNTELDEIAERRARLEPPPAGSARGGRMVAAARQVTNIANALKQTTGVDQAMADIRAQDDTQGVDVGMDDLTGLALSGGGIRSAAFSLGAVQALDATLARRAGAAAAEHTLFEQMDYMSTVSGGGYIGCSISAAMAEAGADFPYPSELVKDEPPVLQHVRDGSNYLFPNGGVWEFFRNLAAYLRGIFANVPVVASLLLALAALTITMKPTTASLQVAKILWWPLDEIKHPAWLGHLAPHDGFWVISTAVVLLLVGLFILWAVWRSNVKVKAAEYRTFGTWVMAGLLIFLLVVLAFELQPKMIDAIGRLDRVVHAEQAPQLAPAADQAKGMSQPAAEQPSEPATEKKETGNGEADKDKAFYDRLLSWIKRITAILTAISALVAAVKVFFGLGEAAPTKRSGLTALFAKYSRKVIYFLAGLPLPLLLWLSYLYLCYWGIQSAPEVGPCCTADASKYANTPHWLASVLGSMAGKPDAIFVPWLAYLIVAGVMAVLAFLMKANANSPYNLYRDRLAATFLVKRKGSAEVASLAGYKLSDIGRGAAPFHLINAAVNLQSSKKANKRGRNAGFFTMSKTHVGSDETGYVTTTDAQSIEDRFTLGSALAVSAAAASTAMGSGTMKPLALTLAILNVRLGYWFSNPKLIAELLAPLKAAGAGFMAKTGAVVSRTAARMKPTNWVNAYWYLGREVLGRMDENQPLVYLSDGGHIENLGLYTLLKRRCKFIIVVDAEADPEMRFGSFVTAQRYARIDLGTRIELRYEKITEAALKAREELSKGDNSGLDKDRPHAAIGTIEYPGGQTGILLYIKLSMTGDENDYIREYARANSAFPHETTGDQFFTEEQFEAYRALGFHAMFASLHGEVSVEVKRGLQKLNRRRRRDRAIQRFQQLFPSISKK